MFLVPGLDVAHLGLGQHQPLGVELLLLRRRRQHRRQHRLHRAVYIQCRAVHPVHGHRRGEAEVVGRHELGDTHLDLLLGLELAQRFVVLLPGGAGVPRHRRHRRGGLGADLESSTPSPQKGLTRLNKGL
eukprot:1185393-Prorocentrum_minimum.AAC.2